MSTDISYSSLITSRNAREFEERRNKERKWHILCLIQQFLQDEGYVNSATCLTNEAPISKTYCVCDNIDLNTIMQEYESYYYLRFQKYPKICKKSTQGEKNNEIDGYQRKKAVNRPNSCTKIDSKQSSLTVIKNTSKPLKNYEDRTMLDLGLKILPLETASKNFSSVNNELEKNAILDTMPTFDDNFKHLMEMGSGIAKDLIVENPNVRWNDIIGHEGAKKILKEAVLYPLQYPELFTGLLGPWKGLLLFGPPGTGKSLLAKAVATECNTRLISISPSLVTSKWRGDSEKLIKVVFELARKNAPSTILIEEIDAMICKRDSPMEHEASRRMKTEMLIQMDKLVHHHNSMHEDQVFLLATSNIPWEIDPAMLRRIEKRILIDLPNMKERQELFQYFLPPNMEKKGCGPHLSCQINYLDLAKVSEGYSGSDIKLVCKEALMERMRDTFLMLENYKKGQHIPSLNLQTLTTKEVQIALSKTKPTAAKLSVKYNQWESEYGSS